MIKGIEHVGLSVTNLERSIGFYRDLMGMEVVRIIEPNPDFPLEKVVGTPGAKARIAHLKSEQSMLELFEYQSPDGHPLPQDHTQADIGFIHAGFTSTDVRADYKVLRENGVDFLGDPIEVRPDVWVVYFKGPDGEVCEIRQS
jgi:glyoxylase I family protein